MSQFGSGLLDNTVKKIRKRKQETADAVGQAMNRRKAPAKGVQKAASKAVRKVTPNKGKATAIRAHTASMQGTAAQGAASKGSARARIAARVAAARKGKGRGLRAGR